MNSFDVQAQADFISLLPLIDDERLAQATSIKSAVAKLTDRPPAQLYAGLTDLVPRLGIQVEMREPQRATVEGVLSRIDVADPIRGNELFFGRTGSVSCAACHRIDGRGNSYAPDLSNIGTRNDARKIATSILHPSETITEGFAMQVITTDDGLTRSGAVLSESGASLRLVQSDGTMEELDISSIEERRKTKNSAMPEGFGLLGNEQVADLVAYLLAQRHQ